MSKGYRDRQTVLADAILALDEVPASHTLHTVSFGEFADHVGGGYHYTLGVSYGVGNTPLARDPREPNPPRVTGEDDDRYTHRQRVHKVISAWQKRFFPVNPEVTGE